MIADAIFFVGVNTSFWEKWCDTIAIPDKNKAFKEML